MSATAQRHGRRADVRRTLRDRRAAREHPPAGPAPGAHRPALRHGILRTSSAGTASLGFLFSLVTVSPSSSSGSNVNFRSQSGRRRRRRASALQQAETSRQAGRDGSLLGWPGRVPATETRSSSLSHGAQPHRRRGPGNFGIDAGRTWGPGQKTPADSLPKRRTMSAPASPRRVSARSILATSGSSASNGISRLPGRGLHQMNAAADARHGRHRLVGARLLRLPRPC